MPNDAQRLAVLQPLLELTTENIDRLVRLTPNLPFNLHDRLTGSFHRETGLFVPRVNRILHEEIWRELLSEPAAEATALGAFALDRSFFVWSSTTIGGVTAPGGLERSVRPLASFLDGKNGWPFMVSVLNANLRPPRGTSERKARLKAREAR